MSVKVELDIQMHQLFLDKQ